jgi:hypothetical protein
MTNEIIMSYNKSSNHWVKKTTTTHEFSYRSMKPSDVNNRKITGIDLVAISLHNLQQ